MPWEQMEHYWGSGGARYEPPRRELEQCQAHHQGGRWVGGLIPRLNFQDSQWGYITLRQPAGLTRTDLQKPFLHLISSRGGGRRDT